MPKEGQKAPEFQALDDTGKSVSLSDLKGKKVVLYFYPKDDTPGCTREACAFRDGIARIKKKGAVLFGVSPDSVGSHQKFKEKFTLNFPLLADPDKRIVQAYGVWKEKSMYGKTYMGVERTTFVIDEQGRVARVFPKVQVDGHCDEVLAALVTSERVWVIQHTPPETLGTITDALKARGISAEYVRPFLGDKVPADMEGAEGLILMGGSMGVHDADQFPYLREEMRLIEQALKKGKPVLGVCLGSQMLASVLGAQVKRGKKEIGWFRVRLEDKAGDDPLWKGITPAFTAYHWHGEVFDLPKDAVHLASSEATAHQAFRHGKNAYGLLFHLEVTENMIREMIRCFSDELERENLDGGWLMQKCGEHSAHLEKLGTTVFGRWADLVKNG